MMEFHPSEMNKPRRKRTGYHPQKTKDYLQPSSYAAERRGIRPMKE
jgi:hypothetical protein